jgi:hypothetical protein
MTDPNHDIDELLRAAARDYNRPGEPPRDRMWQTIRAERARRTHGARTLAWGRFVIPMVAAALLVVGIAIGRLYERMSPTKHGDLAVRPAPTTDSVRLAAPSVTEPPPQVAALPETTSSKETVPQPSPVRGHSTPRVRTTAPSRPDQSNLAFRLAVVQHLAGTEALLTSFRTEAARGDVDAQVTTWARNLLTTTRLLQTAAAQQDPTMKRLLDDLELVLMQIAQYSPTNPHHAEELDLIEHSIQRRGVIGKLRTTIPARLAPSGT